MGPRSRRNRLEDIARHAGVGVATVDRVLNERGGVSEKTTAKGAYKRAITGDKACSAKQSKTSAVD